MKSLITKDNICAVNEAVIQAAAKFSMQNQKKTMQPIFIIVPDRATLQCEKLLIAHAPVLLNVRVVTFTMLFHLIKEIDTPVLDKTSAVLFMWRAIRDVQAGLMYFGRSVEQYAFAEKMFNTINQLESSRADFLNLEKNASTLVTKRKMHDISLIYARYRELCRGYIDGAGILDWLIKNASINKVIKDAHIYVTGFEYISIQREEVLKRISTASRTFTMGVQSDSEMSNAFK